MNVLVKRSIAITYMSTNIIFEFLGPVMAINLYPHEIFENKYYKITLLVFGTLKACILIYHNTIHSYNGLSLYIHYIH